MSPKWSLTLKLLERLGYGKGKVTKKSGDGGIDGYLEKDVFGFEKDDFVDGVDIGGAATFLEFAAESDITLFV